MVSDVCRSTMSDMTLTDIKLDPLSFLYYMMPPAFVCITIGFFIFEYSKIQLNEFDNIFWFMIFINGVIAFGLNVRLVKSFFLIFFVHSIVDSQIFSIFFLNNSFTYDI